MNFKKIFKQIGAVGGLTGAFAIANAIIIHGVPSEQIFFVSTMILTALGIGGGSIYSLISDAQKGKILKTSQESKALIQLIANSDGKVSLAELMIKTDTPLPELKAKLDELQKEGVLGMEIADSGELLYTLSQPVSLEEKLLAHKLVS